MPAYPREWGQSAPRNQAHCNDYKTMWVPTQVVLDQWFSTCESQPLWGSYDPFIAVTYDCQKTQIYILYHNS